MIVQSIQGVWDLAYGNPRNTIYSTVVDPKTHQQYIEVVQYFYDKQANIPPADNKGANVDVNA